LPDLEAQRDDQRCPDPSARNDQRSGRSAGGSAPTARSARRRFAAWALLIVLAVGARLPGITTTSAWHDEATSLQVARLGLYDLVVRMSLADHQPPLIYLLIKLWAMVSWSPVWLRLLPVALSVCGVVFAVLWLRQWDTRAGWLAGLLAATSPMMVHYAQELRAYALFYTALLAGLYCGERLARRYTRRAAVGLLFCTLLMSYAHYVGLCASIALWIYVGLRGAGWRRTAVLACAWIVLAAPMLGVGLLHTSHRTAAGFWVVPLTAQRCGELVGSWIGLTSGRFGQHASIGLWEQAGGTTGHSWAALAMQAVVTAGVGLALITALATRDRPTRAAAGAMLAASIVFFGLIAMVSWMAVPIALGRTTFPAFIPLLGVMALSAAHGTRRALQTVGTVCCALVAGVWLFVSVSLAASDLDRRPNERELFGAIARRLTPADVVIVFSPEMQASAGYFLRDCATAEQILCTDFSRLEDGADGVRLKPVPRKPDPGWFERFRRAVEDARAGHADQHAVWLMDLGPRSGGDADRRRALEWIEARYGIAEKTSVGQRWPLAARRFLPLDAANEDAD